MADDLCGPSTGAKNLVNHVNRDRSLQQDRMINGVPGGSHSTFRSQAARPSGADQVFASFQESNHMDPIRGVSTLGTSLTTVSHPLVPGVSSPGFAVQQQGPHVAMFPPVTPAVITQQHSASRDWVSQFSGMQLGSESMLTAPPPMASPHHMMPVPNHPRLNSAAAFAPPFSMMEPGVAYGGQNQSVMMQPNEPSLDVEAFNRAFGDYDEAEFSQELANWAKEEEGALVEHTIERDPTQDAPSVVDEVKRPDEVDSARRAREDEELARAAISILDSVSENDSEKFRNSHFFGLMRRIGNREVVVDGPNLVNAVTGEAVASEEGGSAGMPTAPTT